MASVEERLALLERQVMNLAQATAELNTVVTRLVEEVMPEDELGMDLDGNALRPDRLEHEEL